MEYAIEWRLQISNMMALFGNAMLLFLLRSSKAVFTLEYTEESRGQLMRIGELARRTGLSIDTLRFYTQAFCTFGKRLTQLCGPHGFDGGKKVNGRKRHILVDTMADLLKVIAHPANSGEREAAKRLLLDISTPLWSRLVKILADGGYAGEAFENWVKDTFSVDLEISLRPNRRAGRVSMPQSAGSSFTLS